MMEMMINELYKAHLLFSIQQAALATLSEEGIPQ